MNQPSHRAACDVYGILYNNRQIFRDHLDEDDMNVLLNDLESLSETRPVNYGSDSYRRETTQVLNRLSMYLDRIF